MKRIDSDDLIIISRFRGLKPWLKPTIHKRKLENKNEIDHFSPIKKEKRKKKVSLKSTSYIQAVWFCIVFFFFLMGLRASND